MLDEVRGGVQIESVGVLSIVVAASIVVVSSSDVFIASPEDVTGLVCISRVGAFRWDDFEESSGECEGAREVPTGCEAAVGIACGVDNEDGEGPIGSEFFALSVVESAEGGFKVRAGCLGVTDVLQEPWPPLQVTFGGHVDRFEGGAQSVVDIGSIDDPFESVDRGLLCEQLVPPLQSSLDVIHHVLNVGIGPVFGAQTAGAFEEHRGHSDASKHELAGVLGVAPKGRLAKTRRSSRVSKGLRFRVARCKLACC